MEKIPRKPALFKTSVSAMLPATTMTGMPCLFASSNIPNGTFPITDWRSTLPSPVIIKSASFIFSSNFNVRSNNSIPGFNFSQQTNIPGAMGYKNTVRGLNVESRYLLVLVDGRRVFTGFRAGGMNGAGSAHNVNAVPLDLIERVEVVNGPSSALYGSDAMVGVLNIITKKSDAPTSAGVGYTSYEVKGRDFYHQTPKDVHRNMMQAHALVSGNIFENMGAMLFIDHQQNDGIKWEKFDTQINTVHGKIDWQVVPELSVNVGAEYTYWHEENGDVFYLGGEDEGWRAENP